MGSPWKLRNGQLAVTVENLQIVGKKKVEEKIVENIKNV